MSRYRLARQTVALSSSLAILINCGGGNEQAFQSIKAQDLEEDIILLASDEYEGRKPTTEGEDLTIGYLKEEFEKLGLEPGNDSIYFQEVPMVELTTDPGAGLVLWGEGTTTRLVYRREYVVWTRRVVARTTLDRSELVFVGYGIVAPEYGWNDYEGLDVKGKTVVILYNDPGFASGDDQLFNGRAMTYYGRWTYKLEEAARQGAAGAFVIHEETAAGYPWEVIRNSSTGSQFDLVKEDKNLSRCAVEGTLAEEAGRGLFQRAGLDFDEVKAMAATRDFEAVSLAHRISVTLENSIRHSVSNNVVALIPGRDRPDEVVIYMAHWDHLGRNSSLRGDQIYNGALDNATGTAALLEIAEAFTLLEKSPKRSVLFLATTGEEQGLLGSRFYAENPLFPLHKTVAAINMDGLNILGPMNDITIIGYGNSELDDYVQVAARKQRREVRPDPETEKGYFYRSDHFSFAREGVPAMYLDGGIDHQEHGEEWTREQLETYVTQNYHKPSDEYSPAWDLTGAAEDLQMLFDIGQRLSNERTFPNWVKGNEFRALRDAQMQAARK
ncbi:M28 family metallopeptidase [Candidatus Neomarinimicrobiota bacterium]